MTGTFRSLTSFNYRLWAAGALVSNVGTWMQRTAQAWLVLTELTHRSASAVGFVTALQFAPLVVLLPLTGYVADRFERRRVLLLTQSAMGALALGLGALTVAGVVTLWQVYAFALLLGCVSAFDTPARQTFVSELVGEALLSNAVALNSASFNAGRMIGPAVAGAVIASVGTGWSFLINGASFGGALLALGLMRRDELHLGARITRARGSLADGLRYVGRRQDLRAVLVMLFLVGTFGLNFQIFLATMAASVFHTDATRYGLLSTMMSLGTVAGALLAARRERPRFGSIVAGAALFGAGLALAAVMPTYALFGAALVLVGFAAQTFTTTSNSTVQSTTEPSMRGRVMALYIAIALGGAPIGAPIVGGIADRFGPRWALATGAAACLLAALYGAWTRRRRVEPRSLADSN